MEAWITQIMEQFGYLGIFFLIALENLFPPIPSEVILTFGGFVTTTSDLTITGVIAVATVGSVVGAVLLYGVGRLLDVQRLEKIIDRYGYILRLTKEDIHKADAWFDKYGIWTVFFCRMIPLIRSLISIPAGMSNMNFPLFLVFTTAGTLIWNTVLVNLGAAVGASWKDIVAYMDIFSTVTYIILGLVFLFVLVWYMKKRKERR